MKNLASPPLGEPVYAALTGGRLRLRHLQCFMAIVRLGRLSSAAEALSVTQPAVTKTLNELEEILGVILLERGRKGVALTPQGQVFLRHATAAAEALEQAVASVAHVPGEAPLRIGVLPTVAAAVLAPALRRMRAVHPDVPAQVSTGSNLELLTRLRRHELDLVVGRVSDPQEMTGLSFEYLYAEPLAIVVRPGHPLAARRRPGMAEVAACGLIVPPAGTMIRHGAESLLAAAGVARPRIAVETLSVSLARSVVAASDEVWFTALSAVEPDLANGALIRLRLETAGTEEPVGVLVRPDATQGAALQALLAALRELAAARQQPQPMV